MPSRAKFGQIECRSGRKARAGLARFFATTADPVAVVERRPGTVAGQSLLIFAVIERRNDEGPRHALAANS